MLPKGVSLRGLEVFAALAETGSVAAAAATTGLSQPSVSQQVRNLEKALGVALVDHGRRPMRLTSAGQSFLTRTEAALGELRQATSEIRVMDLGHLTTLAMGLIDDFDNDLTPRLASILAESLAGCRFKLVTAPSHEISEAIGAGRLHIAVAARTGDALDGVVEYPLVRDPFVLVTPAGMVNGDAGAVTRREPLIRYSSEQLIARQIETHLAQEGQEFEARFEIGSHLALMAMVARGVGWAVTTPLGYMRAARFHDAIEAHPLPFGASARTISLFAGQDWSDRVPLELAATLRGLVQNQIIAPAIEKLPWLAGELAVIGDNGV